MLARCLAGLAKLSIMLSESMLQLAASAFQFYLVTSVDNT